MNWEVKTFSNIILLFFFLLLGYLEAGWLGAIAGGILYGIALTSILLSLIPFFGVWVWYDGFRFLADNLGSFIQVPDLIYKISWVVGTISVGICIATSALTVAVVALIIRHWWISRKKVKQLSASTIIDSLIQLLPSNLLSGFDINNLMGIVNKIAEEIGKLWSKLNTKFVGSAAVFTGIGIASHDFFWESEVHEAGMSRPTHGAYVGLQISVGGMHTILSDKSLSEQISKLVLCYLGVVICYIGFFTMQFIPKGISRIVNHLLWWSGIALIVYNWYSIMGNDIHATYQAKLAKKTKKP